MRNVIITGASRGLGLATANRLALTGFRVLAIARSTTSTVVEEAKRCQSGLILRVPFDLGDTKKIPQLVKRLHKEFGPIYGLVNNAALGTDGALAMMHNSQVEDLIRLNVLSPIVLTKYVVRH